VAYHFKGVDGRKKKENRVVKEGGGKGRRKASREKSLASKRSSHLKPAREKAKPPEVILRRSQFPLPPISMSTDKELCRGNLRKEKRMSLSGGERMRKGESYQNFINDLNGAERDGGRGYRARGERERSRSKIVGSRVAENSGGDRTINSMTAKPPPCAASSSRKGLRKLGDLSTRY